MRTAACLDGGRTGWEHTHVDCSGCAGSTARSNCEHSSTCEDAALQEMEHHIMLHLMPPPTFDIRLGLSCPACCRTVRILPPAGPAGSERPTCPAPACTPRQMVSPLPSPSRTRTEPRINNSESLHCNCRVQGCRSTTASRVAPRRLHWCGGCLRIFRCRFEFTR